MNTLRDSEKLGHADILETSLGDDERHVIRAWRYRGNGTGPNVYIQAGIHGNEQPGIVVARKLIGKLDEAAANNKLQSLVTVVPLCNPVAFSQLVHGELIGRFDIDTGENFNRAFPDLAQAVTEKCRRKQAGAIEIATIRAQLKEALQDHPKRSASDRMKSCLYQLASEHDIVIDLHADNCSLLHLYAPEHETGLTATLSAELGCELALASPRSADGGLDDALNHFWHRVRDQLPHWNPQVLPVAYTVELRGRYALDEEFANRDSDALYNFLLRVGAITGRSVDKNGELSVYPVQGIDSARATELGVLKLHRNLGDRVTEGELIAEIGNFNRRASGCGTELRAGTDGILFCHSYHGVVPIGQVVYKVAGARRLHRYSAQALER